MGNVRVAHYLASFHKNVIFVKTRCCFICPPSLAAVARMPPVISLTMFASANSKFKNVHGGTFLNRPVDKLFRLQMQEVRCSGVFDA